MPPMELPAEFLDMIKDSPHSSRASDDDRGSTDDSGDDNDDISPAPASATEHPSEYAMDSQDLDSFKVTSDIVVTSPGPTQQHHQNQQHQQHAVDVAPVDITGVDITVAAVKEILAELGGKLKTSERLTAMLGLPAFRPAKLAPAWAGRRIIWERVINIEGIMTQIVGTECPQPCNRCSLNLGPFEGCYTVPGLTSSCGNCSYNSQSHRCSNNPKNVGRVPVPRGPRGGSPYTHKRKKPHTFRNAVARAAVATGASSVATASPSTQAASSANATSNTPASSVKANGGGSGKFILQAPLSTEFGVDDAMMLRRVLHEVAEQLIFQQQDTRRIRRVLRDLSGSLEDYASEMQG